MEVVRLTWGTWSELCDFLQHHGGGEFFSGSTGQNQDDMLLVETDSRRVVMRQGDWLVRFTP